MYQCMFSSSYIFLCVPMVKWLCKFTTCTQSLRSRNPDGSLSDNARSKCCFCNFNPTLHVFLFEFKLIALGFILGNRFLTTYVIRFSFQMWFVFAKTTFGVKMIVLFPDMFPQGRVVLKLVRMATCLLARWLPAFYALGVTEHEGITC